MFKMAREPCERITSLKAMCSFPDGVKDWPEKCQLRGIQWVTAFHIVYCVFRGPMLTFCRSPVRWANSTISFPNWLKICTNSWKLLTISRWSKVTRTCRTPGDTTSIQSLCYTFST